MNTIDIYVNKAERFSIGVDGDSGVFYISIPVANRLVDYEEFYKISPEEFSVYINDSQEAMKMADRCRARVMDDRLMMKPGSDRGVAV